MTVLDRLRESAATVRQAVEDPDLRRLQFAWAVSVTGNWAFGIAIALFAYREGGPGLVGLSALLRILPAALAAPFGGALADRWPRKRVMIGSDLCRAALLALAGVAALADLGVAPVLILGGLAGLPEVVFQPARSALLPELVERPDQLVAANAAFSVFEGLGFFAGPALGGFLVALTSPGAVFLLTAAALAGSASLVAGIHAPGDAPVPEAEEEGIAARVLDGLRAINADRRLRLLLALISAQTFVCGVLSVLVVVVALRELDLGEGGVGWLMSCVAVGGILGTGAVGGLLGARGRLAAGFAVGLALWGAPLIAIGLLPHTAVAVVALVLTGVGNTIVDVAGFTLLQRVAPAELLARVFGVVESLVIGTIALGGVLAPVLVSGLGVAGAFVVTGAFLPVVAALSWPVLRGFGRAAPEALGLLRASPVFGRLDAPVIERLARELERREVAAGELVFAQGDPGDRLYLVESGSVGIEVDGRLARRQGPGEQFGEIALLRDVPRTATARATEPSVLRSLERDLFLDAVGGHAASSREAEALARSRLAFARPALGSI